MRAAPAASTNTLPRLMTEAVDTAWVGDTLITGLPRPAQETPTKNRNLHCKRIKNEIARTTQRRQVESQFSHTQSVKVQTLFSKAEDLCLKVSL